MLEKIRLLGFGLIFVLVAGCQPAIQDLRKEVDRGIGGYLGPVTPFAVPVLLRYEGPASADMFTNWAATSSDGQSVTGTLKLSVSLRPIGEQRLWEYQATESTTDGRVQRSLSPPLILARGLSTARGPLRDIDLEFPAYTSAQIKEGMEKNPGLFEKVKHRIRFLQLEMPERALSSGDDLLSAQDFLRTMLAVEFGDLPGVRDMPSSEYIRSNTLSMKVVGLTWRGGRQMLVIKIDGAASLGKDAPVLEVSTRGHWLIDLKTGLTGAYLYASEVRIQQNGKQTINQGVMRSEATF